ncbi:CAP domain-containing protein [Candidatus Daviesbacteria bacterium]|nr:CAP domain-containing protein [Candidatus Daviesbacteria bacterium]
MNWKHLFLPHSQTHKKAHLISAPALAVYIAIFIVLQMGLHLVSTVKPGILGIASNISQQELIKLTNAKREALGLPPVIEDPRLDAAALAKAQNMFAENYWAHYSPSGKDPWGFILGAGYRFTNAGENLARNFYNSNEVVDAWMASPTHRDNIINSKYRNIGMAVLEGTLNGQPTVLVVQEFGTPVEAIAQIPKPQVNQPTSEPILLAEAPKESTPAGVFSASQNQPTPLVVNKKIASGVLVDPYLLTKNIGLGLLFLVGILIITDFFVLRKRAVARVSSSHFPHLAFLAVLTSTLINSNIGSIL